MDIDTEIVFMVNGKVVRPECVTIAVQWEEAHDTGHEIMGAPILAGTELDAVLGFVCDAFPDGWVIRDGKVISAKDAMARSDPDVQPTHTAFAAQESGETYAEMEF